MQQDTIDVIQSQRRFFDTGKTIDVDFRLDQLKKLKASILSQLDNLVAAFKQDYNKCEFDVLSTEVGLVMTELNYFLKHLKRLARPKRVSTSLINFPSSGKIVSIPMGTVLIVSPWNYPFQLTMVPVIGAIAGGNTLVIKPSSKTPTVSKVIADIMSVFDTEYAYVSCQRDLALFDQKYDLVFYTGSADFAKTILKKQAEHLTPCVLELGGKSPCIVDSDADIEVAAKRIAWGKFLNGGQTCVAPDYVVVQKTAKKQFVSRLLYYINEFYYTDGVLNDEYPFVITQSKVDEVLQLINGETILCGGKANGRQMQPTVVDNVTFDSPIMQQEIFAPVLPILQFDKLTDLLNTLKTKPRPLAFYYFSQSQGAGQNVSQNTTSGGACINDVIMHLTEEKLPFGGIGDSGTGSYHGKKSYDTFVHYRSVLVKGSQELNLKYPPYSKSKTDFIKSYFKIRTPKK